MSESNIQISIYDSEKLIESGGPLNEFLWVCAGVNRKVLRQCPTDYAKYAGIGGTILFTALMAMLSGGYALFTVFKSMELAFGFGVFWGLLIFNLDRFIVNTMYSDGKVTISWREFYCGLPRIIMAIFLGIVISMPLELKIFEDEITVTIDEMKADRLKAYTAQDQIRLDSLQKRRADLVASPVDPIYKGRLDVSNSKAQTISGQINSEQAALENMHSQLNQVNGQINALNRKRNSFEPGSDAFNSVQKQINSLSQNRTKLSRNVSELRNKITGLNTELRKSSTEFNDAMNSAEAQRTKDIDLISEDISALKTKIEKSDSIYSGVINKNFDGFQARMSAFSKMKEENSSTKMASVFIMLLFIIIETAPTFFKMMIASGPYDDLLRAEMHRVKVLSEKRISDINDDVNTAVQISVEKNKEKLEAELSANKMVMEKLASAQSELIEQAIADWKEEELKKVKANPSQYIQSTPKNVRK